jgi:hypothetical protein
MRTTFKVLSGLFFIAAAACFAAGTWSWRNAIEENKDPLTIGSTRFDFKAVKGDKLKFEVALKNSGKKPIEIVGSTSFCNPDGCIKNPPDRLTISPRSMINFPIELEVKSPGDHEFPMTIFTDCPKHFKIPVTIRGYVRDVKEKEKLAASDDRS